jgi:uncharacterized damage-inducible protein DinB
MKPDASERLESVEPYQITDIEGFSPQIGRLVGMLSYARQTTLRAVEGLTGPQLDFLHDSTSNSIGALLAHIAAVEDHYQSRTLGPRAQIPGDEPFPWEAALDLGDRARAEIRGHEIGHYTRMLSEVRARTLRELGARDDAWLETRVPFWNGREANYHFQWFHVMEDEVNHRGQIRWLRKRMPRV